MAKLNEGIAKIEKGSVLDTLYNRLLSGLTTAQDETLPDYTSSEYVIETKDQETGAISYIADETKINASISEYKNILLKNSAYMLANAIVGTIVGESGNTGGEGGSGSSGSSGACVAITGDSMTGKLYTLYGFASGDNGIKFFEIYQTPEENVEDRKNVVSIDGELHLPTHGLYINDWNVLSYDNDVLTLQGVNIALNGNVSCSGTIQLGELTIRNNGIDYKGQEFYHAGNSNKAEIDWTMKNGTVAANLLVNGTGIFKSTLTALYGVNFGIGGVSVLSILESGLVKLSGDLNFITGGIKLNGSYVIHPKNKDVISFSAPDKTLNLGDDNTVKINLQTGLYDDDGEYELISKFGSAYFPESFKAGHNLGNVLIETYKQSETNAGVIFSRYLRFNNISGPGFYSDGTTLFLVAPFQYNQANGDDSIQITEYRTASVEYIESLSLYAPLNKKSASLLFSTEADFFVFDKAIEGKISIGIAESKTRLLANELFFDDSIYWLAIEDGVKHYGNAYIVNDIGSVTFSSGFAGSGWKIQKNQLTGNISATFDELTIRKKMRIYELEVQKQSVTNGSLWVSDACSGDLVEEIV